MADINRQLQNLLAERDREIQSIQNRAEWTQTAKNERIAAVRQTYKEEAQRMRAEHQARIQQRVKDARNAVYRVPTDGAIGQGEIEKIFEVYRNLNGALNMDTSDVFEAKEVLSNLMDQAERTGDRMLGLVAYHKALDIFANNATELSDLGMGEVIDRYLADKPQAAKALQRYNDALVEANKGADVQGILTSAMTDRTFEE